MTELKPCPFCGSKCIIIIKPDYYSDDDWVAKCDNCGANVYDISEEEVIKTWNRRCLTEEDVLAIVNGWLDCERYACDLSDEE